jgi:PPOX class probable F420-dependent enzyme
LTPVAATTVEELPDWAVKLLDSARVAHLGLLDDDGRPRVLPVTFALVDGAVWTAVDDKPKDRQGEQLARVRWLRARPRAAITVDHYEDDWTQLAWVQLTGDTAVIDPAGNDQVLEALARRYDHYRRHTPPGPLLRLVPVRAVCWRASEPDPQ